VIPLNALCPECAGQSICAWSDDTGTVYPCGLADGICAIFDHRDDDVCTYRDTYRRPYRSMED
jgi:hypothetical protein